MEWAEEITGNKIIKPQLVSLKPNRFFTFQIVSSLSKLNLDKDEKEKVNLQGNWHIIIYSLIQERVL